MTQHGLERDFGQMGIHDHKLPPSVLPRPKGQNPAPAPYRPGGSTYRPFNEPEDFPLPPPPQGSYLDEHSFPPPPSEPPRGYAYHEAREDFPPPPPAPQQIQSYNPRPESPISMRTSSSGYTVQGVGSSSSSYDTRTDYATPTKVGYQRTSQQSSYSIQGGDGKISPSPFSSNYASVEGKVSPSPYSGSNYANISSLQSSYSPQPTTQVSYSPQPTSHVSYSPQPTSQVSYSPQPTSQVSYSPQPTSQASYSPQPTSQVSYSPQPTSQVYNRPGSAGSSGSGGSGGFYPQTTHRAAYEEQRERPIPGPQVPVGLSMAKPLVSQQARGDRSGKEAEVDALTNLLMQSMEATGEPDFFGMCSKCGRKVMGENNGCTAMDQIFHISCFTCVSCGTLLRGKSFYAMDIKPYCENCYMNTLEKCSVCSKPITDRLLRATGKPYHPDCFVCVVCGKSLDGIPFTVDATNQIHCIEDFHKKFAPRCCLCQYPIMPDQGQEETVRVVAMDKSFHVNCYRCEDCGMLLSSEAEGRGCYPLDDHILCKNCNAKRIQAMTTKMATEL